MYVKKNWWNLCKLKFAVFLGVMPSVLENYLSYVAAACVFLEENGSSRYLRNIKTYLDICKASHFMRH
jgi:hypothetical protein